MLRLLKWAYDLGVQAERRRVKYVLAAQRQRYANEYDLYRLNPEKENQVGRKFEISVNQRATAIISDLIDGRETNPVLAPSPIDEGN